jgi:hypothetical protein
MIRKYCQDKNNTLQQINKEQTKEFLEFVKQNSRINVEKSQLYDNFFSEFSKLLENDREIQDITMLNVINTYDAIIHGGRNGLINSKFLNYMCNNSQGHTPNTGTTILPTSLDNISPNCYLYDDSMNTLGNLHCLNLFANSPASLSGSVQMLLGSPLYPYQVKKINNTTFSEAVKSYGYKM